MPEKKITLADAVYSTLTRGTPDCSVLKRHFMQESGYIEFLGRQRERKNIYRLQPEYVLPLTVVKNDFGYLLFSGNETGREEFRACIQHVADHYFVPGTATWAGWTSMNAPSWRKSYLPLLTRYTPLSDTFR